MKINTQMFVLENFIPNRSKFQGCRGKTIEHRINLNRTQMSRLR